MRKKNTQLIKIENMKMEKEGEELPAGVFLLPNRKLMLAHLTHRC
jgi:uncharacterized membrane protein